MTDPDHHFIHQPNVRLYTERCPTCGSFWACERRGSRTCPICAGRRISEAQAEVTELTHRLNAQKAATARAAKARRKHG